jgi:predicted acyltransferase
MTVPSVRLKSIDVLRGFTMFWIIGGDKIMRALPEISNNVVFRFLDQQLRHVEWVGFQFYDLIFPMFLFLIGVVQPFSIGRRVEKGTKKRELYKHIFQRALIMFTLGLIYYGIKDPNLKSMGYYGVLQFLAVSYFFSALIMLNTGIKGVIFWTSAILLIYFVMLKFIPVPGYGAGVLTPEGNFSKYIGNLASEALSPKFRLVFTPYMLAPVSTALLGVLAGYWMRRKDISPLRIAKGLVIAGAVLIAVGLIWANWLPVIKNLWTGSYVLLTGGISAVLLGVFYWIIDVKGYSKWTFFFTLIGVNSITIYLLARIIDFKAIVVFLSYSIIPVLGKVGPLFIAICVALCHWLVVYWLYKKNIFIKL